VNRRRKLTQRNARLDADELVPGRWQDLTLELDDQERRAVGKSLVERRGRLIESVEDTTQPRAAKRSGLLELAAIISVLRKLRWIDPPPTS
jgi:hypothetical protein